MGNGEVKDEIYRFKQHSIKRVFDKYDPDEALKEIQHQIEIVDDVLVQKEELISELSDVETKITEFEAVVKVEISLAKDEDNGKAKFSNAELRQAELERRRSEDKTASELMKRKAEIEHEIKETGFALELADRQSKFAYAKLRLAESLLNALM
jgi:hypothetical protein